MRRGPIPWIAAIIIAAVLGIIGYAIYGEITEPDSGTIYRKRFLPGSSSTSCSGSRDQGTFYCWTTNTPPCWEIDYRSNGTDGDACVDEDSYHHYEIGGQYP